MDYKEKYEQALERMKSWAKGEHPECFTEAQKAAEFIFPELAESEDERMLRNFKSYLQEEIEAYTYDCRDEEDRQKLKMFKYILAWLEKQDPKKFEEELEKAYKCADEVQYRKGYEDAKCEIEKQGEQNPAWSEEDGTVLNNLIDALANDRIGNNRDEYVDWLKSLKPQPQWKPTVDQMQSLYSVVITYSKKDDYKLTYDSLNSLYDDLKKL